MIDPRTVQRLLDVSEAAALVARLPGEIPTDGFEIHSVWVKPGRHFNVCYRVSGAGVDRLVSLCVVGANEASRVMRRHERIARTRRSEDPPPIALVDADVLAQRFPFDYRLESLEACLHPRAVEALLDGPAVDRCEVAAYRAGMRCQIRYSSGSAARAYGKIAFDREPGRRRRVHREIFDATTSCPMRVPQPMGMVEALGLDLVAAVEGRSLHDLLATGPQAALIAETVQALATLHAVAPAPADRVHGPDQELALVQSWTRWMSVVDPALADPLDRAWALLSAQRPDSAPTTFAHRDFHDKQVLRGDSHLWLLDIDTACTGDVELDLGNFLAHLFLRGVQWDRGPAHAGLEGEAEAAYGTQACARITRWYRRASLVRLACVYHLRPRWRHVAPVLLGEAMTP